MMLQVKIELNGCSTEDLILALNEVKRKLNDGFTSGTGSNEFGSYDFCLDGEEEEHEDE